ncbi:organelle RRM domain-containing protein 1, chloroplastic isoform X2 [Tripterygium wilfordii]|uniref:organelle RRM domain-containing protein 1, chloroplastic isoform X2 n=1 Tax=Tripterygium wilfordii TaxID=458696 RepID=UPI0018F810DF|nr:organelle RRM domain-containing protein 1, chloroplastic isoform X2 [Tripterygium wilfordii]
METLSLSTTTTTTLSTTFPTQTHKSLKLQAITLNPKFPNSPKSNTYRNLSLSSFSSFISCISVSTRIKAASGSSSTLSAPSLGSATTDYHHWMVLMEKPPQGVNSKAEVINYYVKTLERVLGSEKDAQMCIYDASCDTNFGFCCAIDEEASRELASLPGVLLVRPDPDLESEKKDYSISYVQSGPSSPEISSQMLFPAGNTKNWLVRIGKPGFGVATKAQMVDYYAQILTKVLGNENDAQMCIYHISWESNFGFCCILDDECAQELAGVPGVLSVQPDVDFESENKDYGGLSFYTSEKTLRAAFEPFGELVEVKIIMDKISKRSKGYAFIEYTTEEAAGVALKEMNGKIINGWMIVVDVAKSSPPRYSRSRPRPAA